MKNRDLSGWTLYVMECIDEIDNPVFTLQDMYNFEDILQQQYPENRHVKAKIRQQLQILRDKGYIAFLGDGGYKKLSR